MTGVAQCVHQVVTIAFKRAGTRLHPKVWMEEVCASCGAVIDTKKMSRGFEGAGKKGGE